jgi:hypothetical protein
MGNDDWAKMSVSEKLESLKRSVDELIRIESANISVRKTQADRTHERLVQLEGVVRKLVPPANPAATN